MVREGDSVGAAEPHSIRSLLILAARSIIDVHPRFAIGCFVPSVVPGVPFYFLILFLNLPPSPYLRPARPAAAMPHVLGGLVSVGTPGVSLAVLPMGWGVSAEMVFCSLLVTPRCPVSVCRVFFRRPCLPVLLSDPAC